jgi:dihydroneopterin aldolase
MDIIYLHDLKIDAVIGVFDWERQIRQHLVFDIEMGFDISKAASSDHIDDTLDYMAVANRLRDFVGSSEFHLLEALAEESCKIILSEFPVVWVKLKLGKPGAVPGARDVGLVIERGTKA